MLTGCDDPAAALDDAVRARHQPDRLGVRASLWLAIVTIGAPVAMGLYRAASALVGRRSGPSAVDGNH